MISTLLITIISESAVVLGYCVLRKKPIRPILITSFCANFITQSLLWEVLILFFQHYLVTLLVTELLIWLVEGFALYYIPANQLRLTEAILLSLNANLVSFALGLFLRI